MLIHNLRHHEDWSSSCIRLLNACRQGIAFQSFPPKSSAEWLVWLHPFARQFGSTIELASSHIDERRRRKIVASDSMVSDSLSLARLTLHPSCDWKIHRSDTVDTGTMRARMIVMIVSTAASSAHRQSADVIETNLTHSIVRRCR